MRSDFKIITTLEELDQLIEYCKLTKCVSIDWETNGNRVHEDWFKVTCLGVSFQPGFGYVIPMNHKDSPFKNNWEKVLRKFVIEVGENPSITKIGWNLLFEYRIFLKYGYRLAGRIFDAMMAKYLLDEEQPNDLKSQVDFLLPEFSGYDLDYKPGKEAPDDVVRHFWENVPLNELAEYCALDADLTYRLYIHYENRLMDTELYHLFRNFYMPLVRVIAPAILKGMDIDNTYLEWLVKDFESRIQETETKLREIEEVKSFSEYQIESRIDKHIASLEQEIENKNLTDQQIAAREAKISKLLMGEYNTRKESKLFEPLNFSSPKQLAELLFTHKYGFRFSVLEKTAGGEPSTGEASLKKLLAQDTTGFIRGLLDLRGLYKLYSTYIVSMWDNHLSSKSKAHPSYLMHGTVTGRFSSRSPNIQNIPRSTTAQDIKKMFIAPPGYYFVEIDGSQMELRLTAELSKDEAMLSAFREGKNIHVYTATLLTHRPYEDFAKSRKVETHPDHEWAVREHKKAKVLNFTILYGASKYKVSELMTESMKEYIPPEQSQEFIEQWFEAYPEVESWIESTRKKAIKYGYSKSPFGRKRRLPILLNSRNKFSDRGSWNEALRQSVNAVIQGWASDFTQWVNIQTYIAILKGELPSYLRMISTIHDSIEFYVKPEDLKQVITHIQKIGSELPDMKKYLGYGLKSVSMKFSAEFGINWGIMHEYDGKLDYVEFYKQEWEKYNQEKFPHLKF